MNFNIDTSQLSPAPDNIDTSDITGLGLELNENDLRIGSDDEHLNDMYDEEAHELSNILPNLPMDINVLLGKSGFFTMLTLTCFFFFFSSSSSSINFDQTFLYPIPSGQCKPPFPLIIGAHLTTPFHFFFFFFFV